MNPLLWPIDFRVFEAASGRGKMLLTAPSPCEKIVEIRRRLRLINFHFAGRNDDDRLPPVWDEAARRSCILSKLRLFSGNA